MKRLSIVLLLLVLGLSPLVSMADEPGYITHYTSLYAGPGSDFPRVAMLSPGESVTIVGCVDEWSWCDVISYHDRGWVSSRYLEYDYDGQRVIVYDYGWYSHLPVLQFILYAYWDDHYRHYSWYHRRDYWHDHWSHHRPPPSRPRPPPPQPGHDRPHPGTTRPMPPQPGAQPPRPVPPPGARPAPQPMRPVVRPERPLQPISRPRAQPPRPPSQSIHPVAIPARPAMRPSVPPAGPIKPAVRPGPKPPVTHRPIPADKRTDSHGPG